MKKYQKMTTETLIFNYVHFERVWWSSKDWHKDKNSKGKVNCLPILLIFKS